MYLLTIKTKTMAEHSSHRTLNNPNARGFSRRDLLVGLGALGGLAVVGPRITDMFQEKEPESTLEKQKAEFEKMSNAELARWILDSTGDEATPDQPVRTPQNTPAYEDLKNMAEGKPAYRQTLLKLDGEKIKMDVEVNKDILMFRALLTSALRDPVNYFEGKPILIQSGQLTNRSGKHHGRSDESHFLGSSIDFGGAMINGAKSDDIAGNVYPFDSPINKKLGEVADMVGALVGVKTSGAAKSLERVDSLHGEPGLKKDHYHFNASSASAKKHAAVIGTSVIDQPNMYFETDSSVMELSSVGISEEGRDFIHTYETFRRTTYGDAGNGRGTLTIGYGATYYLKGTVITREGKEITIENDGEKPHMGDVITKEEADRLSRVMIEQEYTKPVVHALEESGMLMTQNQMDAVISYAFHRGGSNAAKLIKRLRKLMDTEHANDALAINAAFMYDINTEVAPVFRNGVANRYMDTADIYVRGDYERKSHTFDPRAWDIVIAAYFD